MNKKEILKYLCLTIILCVFILLISATIIKVDSPESMRRKNLIITSALSLFIVDIFLTFIYFAVCQGNYCD
jgi:hypothetical protein